ncbi:hypothetical protein [methane-oxidizing endosymbiont of Gigantopelta aegis]|uniref:hypothetical protein n=1 Tax=methane-oxidizing endosymbiont of Gigantopelta aegis TaxID=2794938 RepID=UPI0018DB8152|nr:hypothetical protein [methane-oxidizing endosymbiont of Gigantopelta aegis]
MSGTVSSTITAPDKEMRPRITPQITERVKLFAEKHGLPVQAVINLAIVEYLNQFD